MKSLRQLYKIGHGPSSSHSMGPAYAAEALLRRVRDPDRVKVTLYGSLAKTGRGHHTDYALASVLGADRTEVVFDTETTDIPHENTLDFEAYKNGRLVCRMRAISVGGGDIEIEGEGVKTESEVYPERTFYEIANTCRRNGLRISDYVIEREGRGIFDYLLRVKRAMWDAVDRGLSTSGVLEGGLNVERKAQYLYEVGRTNERDAARENRLVCAYALAVAEENASGGIVVTAPTCGSCGVVPAALRYISEIEGFEDEKIIRGLAVAGIIGNIVKTNASVSGAECGCQAEIGTATSMAAAALAEMYGMQLDQIEYAAEVAMEHQLGLTCDPVCGLVQIPCIERNAVAAMRAIDALSLSRYLSGTRKISFDLVVETMYETGRDINEHYRETAEGGLAKLYTDKEYYK